MPLFHQSTKPRSCPQPTVGEKKLKWAIKLDRCQSLGLRSDRPEEAPGCPTESPTGLGLRTD